jgi:hypothetical protein
MKYVGYDMDENAICVEAEALIEQLRPLLAGHHPAAVGAVLADLLGTWLSGHHPAELREQLLAAHIEVVREEFLPLAVSEKNDERRPH